MGALTGLRNGFSILLNANRFLPSTQILSVVSIIYQMVFIYKLTSLIRYEEIPCKIMKYAMTLQMGK